MTKRRKTGSIEEDGFLSDEISSLVPKIREQHAAWFGLVESLNRAAMPLLSRHHEVDEASLEKWYAAAYYARVLVNAQGTVLLAERGMLVQAEAMCRATFDALFTFGAIGRRGCETMKALVSDDDYNRAKDLGASKRAIAAGRLTLSPEEMKELERVEAELGAAPGKRISIRTLATWAGLEPQYESIYRSLSKPAHSTLRDVERGLSLDAEGWPASVSWGPDSRELDHVLMAVAESLRLACTVAQKAFGAKLGSDFPELCQRYEELARKTAPV